MRRAGQLHSKGSNTPLLLWALLVLAFSLSVSQASEPLCLVSRKHPISISLNPPHWSGPSYREWPSYEVWSFSKGSDPGISYIEIRLDAIHSTQLDWNTASSEQIKKTFGDFANPMVEKVANIVIGNTPVVVWAAHNVDGELLSAEVRRAGCDFNFLLRTNSRRELQRYQKTFLDVLKSIRIITKEPASSPKAAITPKNKS